MTDQAEVSDNYLTDLEKEALDFLRGLINGTATLAETRHAAANDLLFAIDRISRRYYF